MINKGSKLNIIGAISCFLLFFFTINYWSNLSHDLLQNEHKKLLQELTIDHAIEVEHQINSALYSRQWLISQLRNTPKNIEKLSATVMAIIENNPEIIHIRFSPNSLTSHIFPVKANDKNIGNFIVPPSNSSLQYSPFFSSPKRDRLGGLSFVSHSPVVLNNVFWGYISYHLDLKLILNSSHISGLRNIKYNYQLLHMAPFNKSTILAQSQSPLAQKFYTAAIRVPNNNWQLKLSPADDALKIYATINILFSLLVASVFTLIVFLSLSEPSRLRRKLNKLTNNYNRQSIMLNSILDNISDEVIIADTKGKVILLSKSAKENKHIPLNIDVPYDTEQEEKILFEEDGITIVSPAEHPINKALFHSETMSKTVVVIPTEKRPQRLELYSQPLKNKNLESFGAICVTHSIEGYSNSLISDTSRNIILDMLAHDKPIKEIFEHVIADTEKNIPGVIAAICLTNNRTNKINDIIAPNLPSFYIDSITGLSIADRTISCASAIFLDKLVIVEDIEVHPYWVDYKELAAQANLRSCWSQPIHAANGYILGTLDLYSSSVNQASPATVMALKEAAILLSLTLERHRDSHRLNKMSLAVKHSDNAVSITDSQGIIEYINPKFNQITGFGPIEVIGTLLPALDDNLSTDSNLKEIKQAIENGQQWRGEVKCLNKINEPYWAMMHITSILNDQNKISNLVIVQEDITKISRHHKQINVQSNLDPLTGLFNRVSFEHRLQLLIAQAKEDDSIHALCCINIDQYSEIEQEFGAGASDELLRQVSQVLIKQLRHRDTLARLGADHFTVLMENCQLSPAIRLAKQLNKSIKGYEFSWHHQQIPITISVGITEISSTSPSYQESLIQADLACYSAKESNDLKIATYDEKLSYNKLKSGDFYWAEQIKLAFTEQRFELFVQPIVAVNNRQQMLGYEVYLRMRLENGAMILPQEFLPAAERYNLSLDIDIWVVEQVLSWCQINQEHVEDINNLTINLSASALTDESFTLRLLNLADKYTAIFSKLTFEFSEYSLTSNVSNSKRFINALTHTRCQFSIDNFGHGFSSFSYLKDIAIDQIKIDGALIKSIVFDNISATMVRSIMQLSHVLDIKTIAQSVENQETFDKLAALGVQYAQGFNISKPLPIDSILTLENTNNEKNNNTT